MKAGRRTLFIDLDMKYIDAERLIAEIKKFSATEYGGTTLEDDVANGALDYVIEVVIPSLQQQQHEVDLTEEIDRYCGTRDVRPVPDFMETVARHFAKWGAEHLKK